MTVTGNLRKITGIGYSGAVLSFKPSSLSRSLITSGLASSSVVKTLVYPDGSFSLPLLPGVYAAYLDSFELFTFTVPTGSGTINLSSLVGEIQLDSSAAPIFSRQVILEGVSSVSDPNNNPVFAASNYRRFCFLITAANVGRGAILDLNAKISIESPWVVIRRMVMDSDGDLVVKLDGPWHALTSSISRYRDGVYTLTITGQD